MMNKKYYIILLLSTQLFSQTPITKTLGEFSQLKVYDLINVSLIKSDQNKIIISGEQADAVRIVQKNNTLKVKMKVDKMFSGAKTNLKLYYTSIDEVDANEGAVVTIEEPIKQYELTLKAQEVSKITAVVETKVLNVKSITGSVINTTGNSERQQLNIRTGGIYKGSKTKAQNTTLFIKAGGIAEVKTTDVLDVKIFSGGDVFIYGTPKQLKQNRLFGGRVIFKE